MKNPNSSKDSNESSHAKVTGVNHVTLAVRNIDTSFSFYLDILGLVPVAKWCDGAYLRAGSLWVALIRDDETRNGPLPEYTHLAFTVPEDEFSLAETRIRASGAIIWQENSSEGDSLYFLDPDGHKLEIHASDLERRINEMKVRPNVPDIVFFSET
ncbi:MAG: VOC family protein [Candidatus Ozemobacteraceae bacterium]